MENYTITKNGTSFLSKTNSKVIEALDSVVNKGIRVRFWYGDDKTGKSWIDENDTIGSVGRSSGSYKVPILLKNKRSIGGGAILTQCIVKLVDITNNKILYVHPTFALPKIEAFLCGVMVNDEIYANCGSWDKATKLVKFLIGQRNCK